MRVGRRWAGVLLLAGVVLLAAAPAGAGPDPDEDERKERLPKGGTTTTVTTTTVTSAATTTSDAGVPSTTATVASISTTTAPAESSTTTTTAPSTTTTTVPAAGSAEQVPPFFLRGLCATAGGAFVFAMSNLAPEPVVVELQFNGAPFDTVTLGPGEVYGFRTDAPGTVRATLPAGVFETESFDAPCPVAPGSIGMGGLCRDMTTGYLWLLGNSGPDPVEVEVRLGGSIVGTFTVESGGFAGFTTDMGGQAQALVGGQVVAEAFSSDDPCVRGPASLHALCFAPGQGFRWAVNNEQDIPITVEFRVAGVTQAVLQLAPFEGRDLTTVVAGLGELLLAGEVIASATSENLLCETSISLFSPCADAASGTWWNVSNGSLSVVEVRLELNGVDFDTVVLQPQESRDFSSSEPGTMEAFIDGQVAARSESSPDPCASIIPVCVDVADGQVWALEPLRPVVVDVTIGGAPAGTFDLSFGGLQFASPLPGSAAVLIDGTVVDEAPPSTDPCVGVFAECLDPANGYVFALVNTRDEERTAELRIGADVRVHVLEPFGFVGFALPTPGPIEVFVDGQLVQTVEGSEADCGSPAVSLSGSCFAADLGGYQWDVASQRPFQMTVDLRLNGQPTPGLVALDPFGFRTVSDPQPGLMLAFVNDLLVAEAPSADTPCFEPTTTVPPPRLPGTGRTAGVPVVLGLACLAAGLLVLVAARRRDDRTLVRS